MPAAPRSAAEPQIPGQLPLFDAAALGAYVDDVAKRFVFAPALVIPVVDHITAPERDQR